MKSRSILIFIGLFSGVFLPLSGFTQQLESTDSLRNYRPAGSDNNLKVHYSVGSNFMYIPRHGSITGLNASAFLRYPVSPRFSVEGGLMVGQYYPVLKNVSPESGLNRSFTSLSVYGTAAYQLTQRLSVYGTGIKQLAGTMPMFNTPYSSFTIGSTLNFGNFSVGASVQMSDWNNYFSPSRYSGNPDYLQSFPW